jgi:hypothetical protein
MMTSVGVKSRIVSVSGNIILLALCTALCGNIYYTVMLAGYESDEEYKRGKQKKKKPRKRLLLFVFRVVRSIRDQRETDKR